MTDDRRFDELLEQDWGDAWETLPPAPPLVLVHPKSAQITLRVPAEMVTALRDVARHKALPYHALARSWIAEGVRERYVPSASEEAAALSDPADAQLNVKLTPELLDELKRFSYETRMPYHRLVRVWLDAALRHELEPVTSSPSSLRPSLKELLILLLAVPGPRRNDPAVRGITRLQKLMFVIEKQLGNDPSLFYAHSYGPFDEQVNDAVDGLRMKGLVEGPENRPTTALPTVDEMMASVLRHAGPREEFDVFALTAEGQQAAVQLRNSGVAYAHLAERIQQLRLEWDRPDLVERVYEAFPEYTTRSIIKEQVARRTTTRRRGRK